MTAGKLNSRLKIIIWVIQCVFITTIIFAASQVLSKGNAYSTKSIDLKEKENRLNFLLDIKREYEKNSQYENDIISALPKEEEVSQFLYTLSELGNRHGVSVNRLDFPVTKAAKGAPLKFRSNLELSSSNIQNLESLIEEIENNKRIIDVTSLSIKRVDGGYLAILSISGYFKRWKNLQ